MLPWNLMMTTYPDPGKDPHHPAKEIIGQEDQPLHQELCTQALSIPIFII
jgi:hypothetical protein